jgi:O-antigen/teichoic acid export membrane protein
MQNSPKPAGTFLARNTAFNVLGQLIPILVAVVTIPYVVHRLGTDRFGVLAIAWLLLGYLSLLDFGLGRATTKFIAEALARKEIDKVSELVWTSVGVQIILGCAGALLLVPFAPLLVMKVLRVPEGLAGETRTILLMLLVSLPFVLAGNGLRAVLEALERFDLVNLLRIPATVSVYVLPAAGLLVGLHLPAIVALLVFARFVVCLAHLRFCFVAFPELRFHAPSDGALLLRMLRYGGWVTVSNAVNPVLIYLDRFLISSILSLSLLGIYTVPFEAVTKLWIVPASLSATLFPAFSALGTIQNRDRLVRLYARSFKYLLLFLGPPVVLLIVFCT